MTKSLTEQWREGMLPKGLYYTRSSSGRKGFSIHTGSESHMFSPYYKMANQTEEVLSAVPSYDEWQSYEKCADMLIDVNKKWEKTIKKRKQLEKKLEIATKALEYYSQCKHLNLDILAMLLDKHKKEFADFEVYEDGEHARKALKEIEGIK